MKIKQLNRLTDTLGKRDPGALDKHIDDFLKGFGSSLSVVPNAVVFYFVLNHIVLKILKNKAGHIIWVKWMPFKQYLKDRQRYDNVVVSQSEGE